jgi:hypothetical protein
MQTAVATETPRVAPQAESVGYFAVETQDIAYDPHRTSAGTVSARLEHLHDSGLTVLRLAANGHAFRKLGEPAGGKTRMRLVLESPDALRALTCCLIELLQNEKAIEMLEAVRPGDRSD